MDYRRDKAVAYARDWAFKRNPRYYNFDKLGGDCTNFVSQCLYAGLPIMNYTPDLGWFYLSAQNRSAAWSGVPYLYNFLTRKAKGPGPFGKEMPLDQAEPGDIYQLSFDGKVWGHTLLITKTGTVPDPTNIEVATHTFDALDRPLYSYTYTAGRLIHILGGRP